MLESPEMQGKKDEAKEQARQKAGQAKSRTRNMFDSRKEDMANRVGSVAHAIRQSSEDLRSKNENTAAKYTEIAAQQTENFAEYLRRQDFDEVSRKMTQFARRRPEMFLGGAVVVGFMLSRFLKSSGSDYAYSSREEQYGGPVEERSDWSTGPGREPGTSRGPTVSATDQPL